LYMWIFCIGSPCLITYNFGSAILRATGDTKRPLIYMIIAGILNVLLNLFFVLVCKMDVAGVAIATKFSNLVAAALVLRALMKANDDTRLIWKKVRIYWKNFLDILRMGIPAGIQGSLFSISNVIIQSSVNSFGWVAIAGSTAVQSLEGMAHVACSSYYFSAISFTGQNYGAKKYKRILRSIFICIFCTVVASLLLGGGFFLFGKQLIHIYNPDPEVIRWGLVRARILLTTYFLCGVMEVVTASLRGLGYSMGPTIVTLLGVCVFRVLWVWVIFPMDPTSLTLLLISYPISWVLVAVINGLMLYLVCKKMFRMVVQDKSFGTLAIRR
ncbi:MAG: polysaccharide biosynthesis C-terminal domain-containing protein, partial [Lentisphaeria bacterium]|nr:polysaccharide biosynthesis C-terminal domain-containing protein [Lentisphaeria bacterium]